MSWNVTGIFTGIPYLLQELENKHITICGLSEHWLLKQSTHVLENISSSYSSNVITCDSPRTFFGRQYGRGGVALLWHNDINNLIQVIDSGSDRIAAIKVKLRSNNLYVVQVYLPCVNELIEVFKSEVDQLNDLLSSFENDSQIVLMGDFNAKFNYNGSTNFVRPRDMYIETIAQRYYLKPVTGTTLGSRSRYSFVPGSNGAPSLIDHILVDEGSIPGIASCYIESDAPLNVSRHLPLFVYINVEHMYAYSDSDALPFAKQCYKWTSNTQIQNYENELTSMLRSRNIDYDNVNETYDEIIACINVSAKIHVGTRSFKHYLKPYWSPMLKAYHKNMKLARSIWLSEGRPRSGKAYDDYKLEKRKFRSKMRNAANTFERTEYERLDKLAEMDQKGFWKVINSRKIKTVNVRVTRCYLMMN